MHQNSWPKQRQQTKRQAMEMNPEMSCKQITPQKWAPAVTNYKETTERRWEMTTGGQRSNGNRQTGMETGSGVRAGRQHTTSGADIAGFRPNLTSKQKSPRLARLSKVWLITYYRGNIYGNVTGDFIRIVVVTAYLWKDRKYLRDCVLFSCF